MTEKEFFHLVTGGGEAVQWFVDAGAEHDIPYCVVGDYGVNAYADPVVSLDLDVVVAASEIESLCAALGDKFAIERFEHSLNLSMVASALRLQIQTDPRYEAFLARSRNATVLGYEMKVAALEDVLQGKIWACSDPERRASKRQKDLADIARLLETHPHVEGLIPQTIRQQFL